jgi:hypothetical protein
MIISISENLLPQASEFPEDQNLNVFSGVAGVVFPSRGLIDCSVFIERRLFKCIDYVASDSRIVSHFSRQYTTCDILFIIYT